MKTNVFEFEAEEQLRYARWEGAVKVKSYDPPLRTGQWYVALPHQCDEWQIGGDQDDGTDSLPVLIDRMRLFVDEARQVLEWLETQHDEA